ncbi:hypothetical protein OC834_002783 [Tilletia horrida]|nr:hypothetical protein OC834_002783 [Tilletia horrida]
MRSFTPNLALLCSSLCLLLTPAINASPAASASDATLLLPRIGQVGGGHPCLRDAQCLSQHCDFADGGAKITGFCRLSAQDERCRTGSDCDNRLPCKKKRGHSLGRCVQLDVGGACTENGQCKYAYCRQGVCSLAPAQSICVGNSMCFSNSCTLATCERIGCGAITLCDPITEGGKCRDAADCEIERDAKCVEGKCKLP